MQRKTPRRKSLNSFEIMEQICLMSGWHPGCGAAARWRTWAEFFADADAVKGELLSDPTIRQLYGDAEPFADTVRRELAECPGGVYDTHGGWQGHIGSHIAVRHAHVHIPGDNHTHDGDSGHESRSTSPITTHS